MVGHASLGGEGEKDGGDHASLDVEAYEHR